MVKQLKFGLKGSHGVDKFGHITVYHRGGGHKRKYRIIDFSRNFIELNGIILTIEYDPNRTSFISLICYENGLLSYILTPLNINIGDIVKTTLKNDLRIGNSVLLKNLYKGVIIHNLGINSIKKGRLIRAAGSSGVVLNRFLDRYTVVKLPSGELKAFLDNNFCTVGIVSNESHMYKVLGKAGVNRWLNKRPTVRGVAMNPVDHPHGGGEGKASGGHPRTPWGFPTKGGYKTRSKKKKNKLILKKRYVI